MSDALTDVARRWTELGSSEPMWAALTDGSGRQWDRAEFLANGHREIEVLLGVLETLRVPVRRGVSLDFGCGPGRLSSGLAEAGFETVIGVDVAPTMVAFARELVQQPDRCRFVVNETDRLDAVEDNSVDLVYTARVLQHMPAELSHQYIREFYRVARPGGVVVFQLPYEPVRGPAGAAMRWVPERVLNRLRRGMQMHGTPPTRITELVSSAGGYTVAIREDRSAGPRWVSYLYVTRAAGR